MKKIIVLLIPFLLTGCASVTYNLDIEKNLTVTEKVNITGTKDYFDGYYMNLPITVVTQNYESKFMDPIKNNNYRYELRKNNMPYPSVFVSKHYNSLKNYSQETVFKGQSFEDIVIDENDNLITIKTLGFYPYAPDDSDGSLTRFPISDLLVHIKLPFIVTSNNADSVDKKTNTYTWLITSETKEKEINITFDKTRIYIYNLAMYISIGIISLLVIILIIYLLKIRRKNKDNNRIGA